MIKAWGGFVRGFKFKLQWGQKFTSKKRELKNVMIFLIKKKKILLFIFTGGEERVAGRLNILYFLLFAG